MIKDSIFYALWFNMYCDDLRIFFCPKYSLSSQIHLSFWTKHRSRPCTIAIPLVQATPAHFRRQYWPLLFGHIPCRLWASWTKDEILPHLCCVKPSVSGKVLSPVLMGAPIPNLPSFSSFMLWPLEEQTKQASPKQCLAFIVLQGARGSHATSTVGPPLPLHG